MWEHTAMPAEEINKPKVSFQTLFVFGRNTQAESNVTWPRRKNNNKFYYK